MSVRVVTVDTGGEVEAPDDRPFPGHARPAVDAWAGQVEVVLAGEVVDGKHDRPGLQAPDPSAGSRVHRDPRTRPHRRAELLRDRRRGRGDLDRKVPEAVSAVRS